jgi:hypothetical protein
MDRRQFIFSIAIAAAALSAVARDGHAECGETTAAEFVEALYRKEARLHAAMTPSSENEFQAQFAGELRKLMRAPRRPAKNVRLGPLLHAFFGPGVLPGAEVKVGKVALVSGNAEGPATVGVELEYRGERRGILVHAVREHDAWLIANIVYDSGKSLVSHYRAITAH